MKKQNRGGNTDLNIEAKIINLLPVLFLFWTNFSFPQQPVVDAPIPINGFCSYKNFQSAANYTSLFPVNYNEDSYSDLLLHSSLKRKLVLLTGDSNGEFVKQDSIDIPYQISRIRNLYNNKKEIAGYAFTSRRDRAAGIFLITNDGRFIIKSEIHFKSYPENISSGDINSDGKQEILLSGSAFDGITVLSDSGGNLIETKIEEKTSYSHTIFVDLNNDEIPDIAGFNLISNSIVLFYNNGDGTFRKARVFEVEGKINSLLSFDMNSDFYEDLIFVHQNSIHIYYGDFRSSFENNSVITPLYHPSKIITGDFNRDGKIDIAYADYDQGIISVIYAKDELSFYPEIIYFKKRGIRDIIPFYSKFINAIAGLCSDGEIFIVKKLDSFSENVRLVLSPDPGAITYFNRKNNSITGLAFLDRFNNSLIAVARNNSGVPEYYYRIPLFQVHSEIKTFTLSDNKIGFYCYSFNQELIETVVINFASNKIERKSLYSHGQIKDLKILRDKEENVNIYAVYKIKNKLGLDVFGFSDNNYFNENYEINISGLKSNIVFGSGKSVYYWLEKDDTLKLLKTDFNDINKSPGEIFSLSLNDYFNIILFSGDLLNKDSDILVSYFNSPSEKFRIVSAGNSSYIKINKNDIKNISQFYYGEIKLNGLKKLFIYYPEDQQFVKLDFINEGRKIVNTKVGSGVNVNRYFIKNMNSKNYHIVFTRKDKSYITVKKLIP